MGTFFNRQEVKLFLPDTKGNKDVFTNHVLIIICYWNTYSNYKPSSSPESQSVSLNCIFNTEAHNLPQCFRFMPTINSMSQRWPGLNTIVAVHTTQTQIVNVYLSKMPVLSSLVYLINRLVPISCG